MTWACFFEPFAAATAKSPDERAEPMTHRPAAFAAATVERATPAMTAATSRVRTLRFMVAPFG